MKRSSGFEQLSGGDWQELCVRVLREHHPAPDLVEVPDTDRGDAGLEAFTLSGCAYQCYAPEGEPLTTNQRYVKQRDKMTRDVQKFVGNSSKILAMLPPGLLISRWILLVPQISSKAILEHANKATEKIRGASLSYAAADVVVIALTLDSFQAAKEAVVRRQLANMHLPELDGVDFSDISDDLIQTMSNKLAMTSQYADTDRRGKIINRLLENFVTGQAHRAHVGDHYTELGDRLDSAFADLEDRLAMQYALTELVPDRRLKTVLDDTEKVVGDVLNTRAPQSRVIAEGQVADWLMRCPLDFA